MTVAHRSYGHQSVHYFFRDHTSVPREPLDRAAAWTGSDLAAREAEWSFDLTTAEIDELTDAASAAMRGGGAMEAVRAEDAPLPLLAPRVAAWAAQLATGLGVVRLRGLPVADWGEDLTSWAYWIFGHHLGTPGAQNPQGELLGHVTDYGEEASHAMVRRYRTAGNIDMHCDAADVVGLLCLRPAIEGGQSRIASSVRIFNEITDRRPDLVGRLFEPFALDRRDEEGPGEDPTLDLTPCAFDGTTLRTFWHSEYFRSAPRHAGVPDFDPVTRDLLDTYDGIAAEPGMHLDMWLEPGDVQLISNHTVVHARTGYVDDPAAPRHLLRLWLSLD